MKKMRFAAALAAFILAATGVAQADAFNVRPFIPPTGDLSPLQEIFTGIGSSINVYTDQSAAAIFEPTGFGLSPAAFIAQVTWDQTQPGADIEFGLYEFGNPSNTLTVIPADRTPLTRVVISFDFLANTVTSYYAVSGVLIDTANFTSPFGFYTYTTWSGSGYQYSEDSLNSGRAQQLIFAAKGDRVSLPYPNRILTLNDIAHWYVAAEGLPIDLSGPFEEGGYDYNDMVIMFESITPIPEPGTVILVGSALVALAALRRRKLL